MIWLMIWLLSIVYVIYKMIGSNDKKSLDGVIGNTPGFDAIIFIWGAPFFMLVDLAARWITYIKSKEF
ncbi:MAG: hypothetical protein WCO84_05490 [bacterium]